MKRIKIVQKGWENYTSWLNGVEFENGVSLTAVPRHIADRIGGTISVVEITNGEEGDTVNPAARLISGKDVEAAVVKPLLHPTPEEVEKERKALAEAAGTKPASVFYSREALEEIADHKGLKGLREVAAPWNVRDRSIPALINEILKAQDAYIARVTAAGAPRPAIQGPDIVHLDDKGNEIVEAPQAPVSDTKE
jgi:hypothetical protein